MTNQQLFSSEEAPLSSLGAPNPAQFPGPPALLKNAWSTYKQRLGTFLGIMAIQMAIPMLIVALVTILFLMTVSGGYLNIIISFLKFASENTILLISLIISLMLAAAILIIWGQVSLLYAVKDSAENIGIKEAYRRGWRKIFSYWWLTILMGIIVGGGMMLFVVPGIIFAIWFSLAFFVLIGEGLGGMNALLKSREYVRGKWGAVLWRFLFIFALSFVVGLAVALITNALFIFIFQIIFPIFLVPLIMTYSFLVYNNLKSLKGEFVFAPTTKQKITPVIIGILGFALIFGIAFLLSIGTSLSKCDLPIFKIFSSKCVLMPTVESAHPLPKNFVRFEIDNNANLVGTTETSKTKILFNLADIFNARRDLLSFPYKILPLDPAFYNRNRNLFIVGPVDPRGYLLGRLNILNIDTKSVADTSYFVNVLFDQPYSAGLAVSSDRLKIIAFRDVTCDDANEIDVFHSNVERLNFELRKDETIIVPSGGMGGCNVPDVQWAYNEQTKEETLRINVYNKNNLRSAPVREINVSVPLLQEEEFSSLPAFGTVETEKANILMRDDQRIKDIKRIQLALELYFDDNGHYPLFLGELVPKYLPKIPKDPLLGSNYRYAPLQIGGRCDSYHLAAIPENKENPVLKAARKAVRSPNVCDGFLGSDFDASGYDSVIYDVMP